MESPVRISLGAALVAYLLLLSSTPAGGNALPLETTPATVPDDRPRPARLNATWPRSRPRGLDPVLNELPKGSVSEEHTEKNAKYKHRGRTRYNSRSTTVSPLRRVRTTTEETVPGVIIVTPTAEVKKPEQIMDSMRNYKRTKMPVSTSTTTEDSKSEEDDDDDDSFEKFTSKFDDNNFFTIPGFDDDHGKDSIKSPSDKYSDYTSTVLSSFSSFLPKDDADSPYKSNFFDFDTDLTTPKHDFFDRKYQEVSSSIIKNLDAIKARSPRPNVTNVHISEKVGLSPNFTKPGNRSTIIIKNTKETRLIDNDGAGTNNKELSDVHGTSVYYEMSVLSTETYAINNSNEDDCDNDTLPSEPTVQTPAEDELASIQGTPSNLFPVSTKPLFPDPELGSTVSNFLQSSSSLPPFFNPSSSIPYSTINSISSTEKTTRPFPNSFPSRNRGYSKRLNGFTGTKDSPNNVTPTADNIQTHNVRNSTRKFHYTTPKAKPTWMTPRRNITKTYPKPTYPTTIYAEHFSIKDRKTTTVRPKQSNKTVLTTVSSDIDPVLQSDVSGVKKLVQSQTISDNSIPSLSKRGSMKFGTTTATSAEEEATTTSELEIPPTLTAWALASLRSPPGPANITSSTQKSVEENEVQKINEIADKNEITTSSTSTTQTPEMNNLATKKITDIDQNKLPWRPVFPHASPDPDMNTEVIPTENKSERLPAESNISVQNSSQPITSTATEGVKTETEVTEDNTKAKETVTSWVPFTKSEVNSGGTFASITKFPKGVTTPLDETPKQNNEIVTEAIAEESATTDYEITTKRFSYVPTEAVTDKVESSTPSEWHPVAPTRTRATTIEDRPITTYRPKYYTTTDNAEEFTTNIPETTPLIEVSSLSVTNVTNLQSESPAPTTQVVDTTSKQPATHAAITEIDLPTETTTEIVQATFAQTEATTEVVTDKSIQTESSEAGVSTEVSETPPSAMKENISEDSSGSNEVITMETTKMVPSSSTTSSTSTTTTKTTTTTSTTTTTPAPTTEERKETTTEEETTTSQVSTVPVEKIAETEVDVETTTELGTKPIGELEDVSSYGDVTTERLTPMEEAGSGAAVAIAVSTIGVIALILLIGLLLVVRRRGRRGVYAQRCTPVSLDAYSLDSVSVGHRKGNQRLRASKRSYGNPAYDDEVTSHPMNYAALANFALDMESMSTEFAEIPSITVRPDEVPPGCEDKNRYSNVLPLPETRVPLKRVGNDPTSEYINANYITGPGNIKNYYIACQAPLPNTVADFWRMVWEQNSRVIVMLTEYMENGVEKCYEYLPPSEVSDNKRTFGEFQIMLKKREQRDKYAVSSVQVINLTTRTWREVTHLWYFWPAKGVPDDYDSVLDFLSEMRSYMKVSQSAKEYDEEGVEVIYGDGSRSSYGNLSKLREEGSPGNGVNVYSPAKAEEMMRRGQATNGTLSRMKAAAEVEGVRPCTVVCASGAGRSCALIALDVCARALTAHAADVPRVVRELRAQRPHSLSNRHHYIFLYKVLSEYGNKLNGGGVDTI
ncbi:mucin-2 [Cydia splendana]|uniref:mucin-2 n=1 Tax=Cydia splendana TaxID=1100963 RepID=UPI002135D2C9